jgi:hypothetical protein
MRSFGSVLGLPPPSDPAHSEAVRALEERMGILVELCADLANLLGVALRSRSPDASSFPDTSLPLELVGGYTAPMSIAGSQDEMIRQFASRTAEAARAMRQPLARLVAALRSAGDSNLEPLAQRCEDMLRAWFKNVSDDELRGT